MNQTSQPYLIFLYVTLQQTDLLLDLFESLLQVPAIQQNLLLHEKLKIVYDQQIKSVCDHISNQIKTLE